MTAAPGARVSPWTAGAALFTGALAVRAVHLWQIHREPFFTVLVGDARAYDLWARQISAGDWVGHDVFYQAPLYPYFLAVLYTLIGPDLTAVRVVQAIVGSLACVLLALAGWRLFDHRTGITAGVLLAFYAPAIFFDGLIQKSVLDGLLVCAILWLVSLAGPWSGREPDGVSRWTWFGLGASVAALGLTRENALVAVPVVAAWLSFDRRVAGGRVRALPAFAAGLAVLLAPVAVRNAAISGEWHLTTSQAGPNLYIGNNEEATGMYRPLRVGRGTAEYERADATELAERAAGRALSPSAVSGYWTRRALDFVTAQPRAWLALMARKAMLLVNATEIADTESLEMQAERSVMLRLGSLVGHFGVLAPLAVLGLWAWRARLRRVWLIPALAAAYAGSVMLFYVSARYRFPLVPFVTLLAAAGLTSVRRAFGAASLRGRVAVTAVAALVAAIVNWPLLSHESMQAISEVNLGVVLQAEGRLSEAMDRYRMAIALQPADPAGYLNLGAALYASGDRKAAEDQFRAAATVSPDSSEAHFFLGRALLEDGRVTEGIDELRRAVLAAPDSTGPRTSLGVALASQGRFPEAIVLFREVARLDPGSGLAHWNLGSALAANGDLAEGTRYLEEAVRLDPGNRQAQADLEAIREMTR